MSPSIGIAIASDSCGKIRDLGFAASMHINMYGQRFAIVSDPFDDGGFIAVRATSGNDPEVRTLRLPIAILVGRADRFQEQPEVPETATHSRSGFDIRISNPDFNQGERR